MAGEVELIKERLDVADVVGEYVPLKRAGAHWKGLCPFHQEKTPSFVVSPQKGIWHCFGCGKGGDVFGFIQEIEKLDFPEALKLLAERAGVQLPERAAFTKDSRDKRQRLFDLLSLAARFYHTVLMKHEEGKRARAYLAERGVIEDTMREFMIGYAPMRWDSIQEFLQGRGYSLAEVIEAGLAGRGQGDKTYDRFRGRIMFPVTDVQGRVVAFGGRIVPWHATGEEGKYVNSPETKLYEKRRTIYNLARAKAALRHNQPCVVVEGYMDVVLLHQAGVRNVVASSGTAFTPEHVALLKRYTPVLHFAFDADAAGNKATVSATEAALAAGLQVATLVLPAGEDPADVVVKHPTQVSEIFSQPRSLVAVLLERLQRHQTSDNRQEILAALLPLLARVANPIQQGEMVREVSTTLAIPETTVIHLLSQATRAPQRPAPPADAPAASAQPTAAAERELLGLVLVSRSAREAVWGKLRPDFFLEKDSRDLYNTMHSLKGEEWLDHIPLAQQTFAYALAAVAEGQLAKSSDGAVGEAHGLLKFLTRRYLEMQLQDMQRRIAGATGPERIRMLQEFQTAAEQLSAVK